MTARRRAVAAGHFCLDIIPGFDGVSSADFRRGFAPGHLLEVGPATLSTGGSASNTGLALHKLGISTHVMGKIGRDLFGNAVRQIMESFGPGLMDGMIVDPHASTSYTVVIQPPDKDRFFVHYPGANDTFGQEDVRYDLLADAELFHFGYPPLLKQMYENEGAELTTLFRRAWEAGVTTSLDMAFPGASALNADWRRILERTLPYVDIFLPSIEETLVMLHSDHYRRLLRTADGDILSQITPELLTEISDELLAFGARIVGLKLGYRGFYLRTAGEGALTSMARRWSWDSHLWADRELWAPCFRVQVVGTAGSGDCTIAGFLAALLRGCGPAEAATMAVAVGACNVEAADTLSGVRTWQETADRVAAGWPRLDLALDAPGWRADAASGLWFRDNGGEDGWLRVKQTSGAAA